MNDDHSLLWIFVEVFYDAINKASIKISLSFSILNEEKEKMTVFK
jgi:hypothetical protein